jgi:ABC-type glycerol-3-phosphate transport system substrate-binding protein
MISKVLRIAYLLIFAALAGCANIESLLSQPTPVSISQASATPQPVPVATQTALPATEARVLRVWLPPRFDPNADTESANLLKQRIVDFEATHPDLKIEVRIKSETGETSLLNSLFVTGNAAPAALPDLVALSRPDLEAAALKGLLHPVDGLSTVLDDPNWYPFARELGHIQNIGYGLPFAGDALVLIHHPELEINTWDEILASQEALVFSVGDSQSLVALSLYVSAGGKLVNEQGLPTLDEEPLTQTLTLIQDGFESNTFLPSLTGFESDPQAFQAYRNRSAKMVIAWALNYRAGEDGVMLPIPGLNGASYTFANGWIWALAGSDSEEQQVATELAEFLIADEFVSNWLENTGYLPTRLSQGTEASVILESAHALPSNEVLLVLGPIMEQALSRILNGDQVGAVVRSVMEQVK